MKKTKQKTPIESKPQEKYVKALLSTGKIEYLKSPPEPRAANDLVLIITRINNDDERGKMFSNTTLVGYWYVAKDGGFINKDHVVKVFAK